MIKIINEEAFQVSQKSIHSYFSFQSFWWWTTFGNYSKLIWRSEFMALAKVIKSHSLFYYCKWESIIDCLFVEKKISEEQNSKFDKSIFGICQFIRGIQNTCMFERRQRLLIDEQVDYNIILLKIHFEWNDVKFNNDQLKLDTRRKRLRVFRLFVSFFFSFSQMYWKSVIIYRPHAHEKIQS